MKNKDLIIHLWLMLGLYGGTISNLYLALGSFILAGIIIVIGDWER